MPAWYMFVRQQGAGPIEQIAVTHLRRTDPFAAPAAEALVKMPGQRLVGLQAASDHLRLITAGYAYINEPLTSQASQWYYTAKVEFGI